MLSEILDNFFSLIKWISSSDLSSFFSGFWGKLLAIFAIIIGSKIVTNILKTSVKRMDKVAESKGLKHLDISDHAINLFEKLIGYVISTLGFFLILYVMGLNEVLVAFITGAGVAGLAIGFASKDLVANVMSGIMLIFDRPFDIGDRIELAKVKGKVREITIRSTKIESFNGNIISIPNNKLATNYIINYSKSKYKKIEVNFDLSTDTDLNKVFKIIDKKLNKLEWKSKKEPKVYVENISRKAINIVVQVWTSNKDIRQKQTELISELATELLHNHVKYKISEKM